MPGSNGETPAQTDGTTTPETPTQGNAGTETNPTTTPETNTSTAPTSGELVVTAPNVTLRSAADAAANSLGTLAAGSTVQILSLIHI